MGHIGSVNKRIRIPKDGRLYVSRKMRWRGADVELVRWGRVGADRQINIMCVRRPQSTFRLVQSRNDRGRIKLRPLRRKKLRFCDWAYGDARFIYNSYSWDNRSILSKRIMLKSRWRENQEFSYWHSYLNVDSW